MDIRPGTGLRWLRALFLSAAALCLGVLAHAGSGGILPGRGAFVALLLLGAVATAPLLGRPAPTRRVVLLLVSGQTLVHGALTALGGHRGDPPLRTADAAVGVPAQHWQPAGGVARSGSLYDQFAAARPGPAGTGLAVPAWVQHLAADLTGPHAVMALAHLVAAALVGLWLAAGERALWTLLTLAGRVVTAAVQRVLLAAGLARGLRPGAGARLPVLVAVGGAPPPRGSCPHSVVRRGPPVLRAA